MIRISIWEVICLLADHRFTDVTLRDLAFRALAVCAQHLKGAQGGSVKAWSRRGPN